LDVLAEFFCFGFSKHGFACTACLRFLVDSLEECIVLC
jgi:hypothetical protein